MGVRVGVEVAVKVGVKVNVGVNVNVVVGVRVGVALGVKDGSKQTGNESTRAAGVGTFLRSPYIPEPTRAEGDVAVIGVPYDEGVTARTGTREGPRALRDISANWAYRDGTEPYWDGEAGVSLLGGVRFVDTGDVQLAPTAPADIKHSNWGFLFKHLPYLAI